MTRGKLYQSPGFVWHITHRCHNKDHLLKFSIDQKAWLLWLFKAKKKYGLIILNYMVTSNHIHLLVFNDGRPDIISRSMLLVASRTAIEYNKRKGRSGAFWEDNYHATAVESGRHLVQCMLYIDLNMIRAGVVKHPREWPMSGYLELTERKRKRYRLIDKAMLLDLLDIRDSSEFKEKYEIWISEKLSVGELVRENIWTESLAIGNREFVEQFQERHASNLHHEVCDNKGGTFILK